METINSVATAAAKAVWGENTAQQQHGEEPVSGKTGDTSKGEPYDAGNIEESKNTTNGSAAPNQSTPGLNGAAEFSKSTGTAATSEETPDHPSTHLKAKGVPADTTQGQNDVREPEDPQTNPQSAPTDVDDTGAGPNEAQKLDGPGPKPIEEVAREHGGDAGKSSSRVGVDETTSSASSKGKGAGKEEEEEEEEKKEDGPNAKSKGEGTGEKYVKSSGLKADGGDFDVSQPGAGREADRLMEEKGIHNPNTDSPSKGSHEGESTGSKSGEKKGLGQKIKEKLHRH